MMSAEPTERSSLGIADDDPLIVWVGRLDPVKGLTFLLEAFQGVLGQHPAHLLLVGDGPMRLTLEERIANLDLDERAHLLGARRDVPSLLRAANVFVLPSRTEGLPNALLEAMAAGCPIVTTDVPGCRDLIEHETTGLIVPYAGTEELSQALERLLADRALAVRLGQAAADAVQTHWSIENTWNAYASLYEEIISVS